MADEKLFAEETKKYLEAHPPAAAHVQRFERFYQTYGAYLSITQTRVIVRESGASNTEADLSAAISRANF